MGNGIDLIFDIWGKQKGYVFVPYKNHSTDHWEEQSFRWPKEKDKVRDWIVRYESEGNSVYWCPTLFTQPIRKKDYVKSVRCLWADLDEVNPTKLPKKLKPHLAYETSPKRFQSLWYLDGDYEPEEAESVNRNITYHIGADPGGWDLTQVLRIPELRNYKYKNAPKGKLLWNKDKTIPLGFFDFVPEHEDEEYEDGDITWDDEATLTELVAEHKKIIKGKLFELVFATEAEVYDNDRSAKLWELECRLFELGLDESTVANIVRLSNWNKYKGRPDELKRISIEVMKAKAEAGQSQTTGNTARFKDRHGKTWQTYQDLMSLPMSDPGWLVEGWWQKSSHGFVAGEPKTYKSTFTADFAASVASGEPLYGIFPVHTQGPVVFIQEENSPYLMQDRFRKVAKNKGLLDGSVKKVSKTELTVKFPPDLPISFLNNKGFDFTEEESQELLEAHIREVKPVLVIFDPLYLMLGGKDENSSKDLRPILNWLLYLRYTYDTAIMVVHHWNKSGQSPRGGQRMLGSVTFHGWVESAVYQMVKNEEEHEITVEREFRSYSKPKNIDVKYVMGPPGTDEYEVEVSESSNSDELFEIIRSSNGVSEKDLVAATNLGRTALKRRLEALEKKGMIYCDKERRPALWFAVTANVREDGGEEDEG